MPLEMRDVNEFLILANVRTDTVLKAAWEEFDPWGENAIRNVRVGRRLRL